jgi:hypothetical protein
MELSDVKHTREQPANRPYYVAWVQALLHSISSDDGASYYDGPVDGICTTALVEAISRFQIAEGLAREPAVQPWQRSLARLANGEMEQLGLIDGPESKTAQALLRKVPQSLATLCPTVGGVRPFVLASLSDDPAAGFAGFVWIDGGGNAIGDDGPLSRLEATDRASADAIRQLFPRYVRPTTMIAAASQEGAKETTKDRAGEDQLAELHFDGKMLRWIENSGVSFSWPAVSGVPGFQGKRFQSLEFKGPLPEGIWVAKQSQFQSFIMLPIYQMIGSLVGQGRWRGGPRTWGLHRIWLVPVSVPQIYGRSNFSIHGGSSPGSAGCIDMTDHMDDFADKFLKYGKDMAVIVKYDN